MHPESSSQLTPIPLESLGHLEHALGDVCTQITSKMHEEARNVTSKSDTVKPQGTYLAWIDARESGLEETIQKEFADNEPEKKGPADYFAKIANVGVANGSDFDSSGESNMFFRLNFAVSRSELEEMLNRIEKALLNMR
jgi:bifunctional pyridoxal-dependent enzyme with beta-cystathionase and maltose regulon repressor activities